MSRLVLQKAFKFLNRFGPIVKDLLHIKERKDVLANTNAQSVRENG